MRLDFLDRTEELKRLRAAVGKRDGTLCCLYGRRRCGKSRLLQEVLPAARSVYCVADEREPPLQRSALAKAIAARLPGFDRVGYPDWDSLLRRWYEQAPRGSILALDEFPYLVTASRELPSQIQNCVDQHGSRGLHLILCGSSQRMMQGLVLDGTAPLYGRAAQIIEVRPLGAYWLRQALGRVSARDVLTAYAIWGGVPRYWELAAEHRSIWSAMHDLLLHPMGALHQEPRPLLLDDIRETSQAASILALVGQGCHRLAEIAGRLEKPATSLSRPLQRLVDLGLVKRERPYGESERTSKRTLYQLADPFLLFWFRFIDQNRSRLQAGQSDVVGKLIREQFPQHLGEVWEELVRSAVPRMEIAGRRWSIAGRWWGPGVDRKPMECDVLASSIDGQALLVGEVRLQQTTRQARQGAQEVRAKIERLPLAREFKKIVPVVFMLGAHRSDIGAIQVSADDVLDVLR